MSTPSKFIDLTVKTLDSQNHAFTLADDITVREFKEHIAGTVNVPADSQRLIYCGRVLQDEKRLNEYDVNGKVIHLVQRAPPQSAQRGNSGGQSQNRGRDDQQPPRVRARQTRTQFHGYPMYLGSFSIPADVVDGHEWPIPQLSDTLSNSRLVVARKMFDQANRVLDRLENPAAAAANEAAAPETDDSASSAGTAGSTTSHHEEAMNRTERLLQQLSGAGGPMGGIFEIATAIAGSARPTYVWSSRTGGGEAGTEPSAPAAESSDESQPASEEQQSQQPSRQGSANSSTDSTGNARTSRPSAPEAPRPPQMAQLLGRLMETQDRLRPFLTRYRELMDLDPEIPGGRNAAGEDIGTVEDNQRIADGVTECFHFLSHANHALSDIIVDMGQLPPRNLRCRPMLIQHSATLQSGIPIQVEARISVARNDGSNGESGGEENSDSASRPPTSATSTPPTSQNPIDLTFMTEHQDQTATAEGQQDQQQRQSHNQPQADSPFGAIFNITNNMEVLMEMGPPESGGPPGSNGANATGTEQSQNNGSNNNNNNNNNNNAPGTSGVAGIFPWGPVPPPEVIRNLMHVVAGYMAQSAATVTTVATTTSTATPTTCLQQRVAVGVGGVPAPNPGQSTQARSNVGTHPTTSTQTRSTPRPHVFHPHPLGVGVGMGQNLDFDPFLPCNSHHIRRTPNATPTNSAATSSPQQPAQQQFNLSQTTQPSSTTDTAETQADTPSTTTGESESYVSLCDEIANLRGSTGSRLNEGQSEGIFSLNDVLLARGINNVLLSADEARRDSTPRVLERLLRSCADIEVSEWYALIETGEFNRDDCWRRLRPHITCQLLSSFHPNAAKNILAELRPLLRKVFRNTARANILESGTIDLLATVGAVIFRHVQIAVRYVDRNVYHAYDDQWGRGLVNIVRNFGRELCSVLRFSLRTQQKGLEAFIKCLAIKLTNRIDNQEVRQWILRSVCHWFIEYSRNVEQLPNSQIRPLLVYSEVNNVADSVESADAEANATPSEPQPEPMETEEASDNQTINDPLELDDGEEVPTTFPGHEALLPEWVPIIARDGIRQRRQLQLQGGSVTAFSDAYLDGLPSKRRKIVEQQKPRLLVSPTPNHSSIPASMERLVRESVGRAGVEEADGAAAAVAADPGVRRAFGQAIRDCLNPRRLQTPDFPDAQRFPNATRYFTEKDRPPKQ